MRFETNLKILETITKGVDLKEYSGFGGLYKVMKQEDHQKLKDVLGETSYNQIMASSKTAYFTPKNIIDFMYKALDRLGFKAGRILEPACGSGAFIFNMPDSMRMQSSIHAVELDKISTQIAQGICPYANISNCSFERYQEGGFDLIIGNPPYSNTVIYDKDPELNNRVIHHYFLAKSIKLFKRGWDTSFCGTTVLSG
jgi:type I restriction-modification system DNA methylase subunit